MPSFPESSKELLWKVGILCLWSQILLSVPPAYIIFLLCFSGQRCGNCPLENNCHCACMNCISHECSSSGVQVKAAWLDCITLHVTVCLSHPSDPFPALTGHTLPLAWPLSAKHALCKQQAAAISQQGAGGPLGAVAPCRTGQNTP